jgi:hypothetical protein
MANAEHVTLKLIRNLLLLLRPKAEMADPLWMQRKAGLAQSHRYNGCDLANFRVKEVENYSNMTICG